MTFSEAVKSGFDNYATFTGRASRPAYWWWFLFGILVSIGANIIDAIIGSFGVVSGLAALALLLPGLAVSVRRFHDIDKSGWWILIFLIPIVGFVLWLIWFTREGDAGENQYGPPPVAAAPAPAPAA
jgi:uncharacterized membrane protein YhaH (DUF805 family)